MPFTWWRKNVIEPIHNARIPLGARGRFIMGCVYCLSPLVVGIPLMQWAIAQSEKNLGKDVRKNHASRFANTKPCHTCFAQGEKLRGREKDIRIRTDPSWGATQGGEDDPTLAATWAPHKNRKRVGNEGEQYQDLGELVDDNKRGLAKILAEAEARQKKRQQGQQ
jgi:hypothetical protein